jgi:hypothetical protein
MSGDIDAAASLVTAGLVASVLDSEAAKAGEQEQSCANCGAALTGPFCHACGQRAHVHRSLLHLGEEFLHGLLHFDAKAWRTLPMLAFKPGQLTRRYLDGQRTRFVSPLAMFLFMMFFMFFVASFTNVSESSTEKGVATQRVRMEAEVVKARAKLAKAESDLATAAGTVAGVQELNDGVAQLRSELAQHEKALKIFNSAIEDPDAKNADGTPVHSNDFSITTGHDSFDKTVKKAMKNRELIGYKLKSAASKYTFLLVPISLPFLWLMFCRRRDVTMYDHAVFTLYSLSFMAALFSAAFLIAFAGFNRFDFWMVVLVPPLHMFAQLRGTYGLTIWSALWRTAFLLFSALLVMLVYLTFIFVLSVR